MIHLDRKVRANTATLMDRVRFALLRRLVRNVQVYDGEHAYTFRCESAVDVWRARTLLVKEQGTVQWIRSEIRAGDVFYDIGANIGIYVPLAAKAVGAQGKVYAFEPHVVNVHSLLHNVHINGLEGVVEVLSCALNDTEGFFDFNYHSFVSGSSMSQLNDRRDDKNREFRPVFTERKYATTIDHLVGKGVLRPADHIKIDVDGNEMLVLRGMRQLLGSARKPKSIQVEVNLRYKDALFQYMQECGYAIAQRHYTAAGKVELASGADPEAIAYNAIFKPDPRTEVHRRR
jgi:FkbM family methyltransferase